MYAIQTQTQTQTQTQNILFDISMKGYSVYKIKNQETCVKFHKEFALVRPPRPGTCLLISNLMSKHTKTLLQRYGNGYHKTNFSLVHEFNMF